MILFYEKEIHMKRIFILVAANILFPLSLYSMIDPRLVVCTDLVAALPVEEVHNEETFPKLRDVLAIVLAQIPPAGLNLAELLLHQDVQVANMHVDAEEEERLGAVGEIVNALAPHLPPGIAAIIHHVNAMDPIRLTQERRFQIIGAFVFRRTGQQVAPMIDVVQEFNALKEEFVYLKKMCLRKGEQDNEELARDALERMVDRLNNLEQARVMRTNEMYLERLHQARAAVIDFQNFEPRRDTMTVWWHMASSFGIRLSALRNFLDTVRVV